MLCDTSGVGERSGVLSTGSPFGHHPRLSMVCPLQGQWMRAGRFLFSLPLHSPLLHGFALRVSPAVTHSVSPPGTVGAGWEVSLFSPSPLLHGFSLRASPAVTHGVSPSRDSGCSSHHKKSGISDKKRPKMGLFCSYMTKVCIVSVANLSQLCTLLLHYLSCILAA